MKNTNKVNIEYVKIFNIEDITLINVDLLTAFPLTWKEKKKYSIWK